MSLLLLPVAMHKAIRQEGGAFKEKFLQALEQGVSICWKVSFCLSWHSASYFEQSWIIKFIRKLGVCAWRCQLFGEGDTTVISSISTSISIVIIIIIWRKKVLSPPWFSTLSIWCFILTVLPLVLADLWKKMN